MIHQIFRPILSLLLVGLFFYFIIYHLYKFEFDSYLKKFFSLLSTYSLGYILYFSLNGINMIITSWSKNLIRENLNLLSISTEINQQFKIDLKNFLMFYVVLIIFHELFSGFKTFYQYAFVAHVKKHFNDTFVNKILLQKDAFFSKYSNAFIINAINNVTTGIDDGSYFMKKMINGVVYGFSSLFLFYYINKIFVITTILWILIWQILIFYFSNKAYNIYEKVCTSRYNLNVNLGDIFNNASSVKIFDTTQYEQERNYDLSKNLLKSEINANILFFQANTLSTLFFAFVYSVNIYLVYDLFLKGLVGIGDIQFIFMTTRELFSKIDDFSDNMMELSKMLKQISEGMKIIYENEENNFLIEEKYLKESLNVKNFDLIVRHVDFEYPSGYIMKIEEEITIKEGATVAVIGKSGSGKSSFFKVLMGLLSPKSGEIIVDGKNILNYSTQARTSLFALVPQEIALFHRSVLENLTYGSFNINEKTTENIIQKIQLNEWIDLVEGGKDAILGDNNDMSGGQKQRLTIARGLLRKAKIFLFDESTSSLDIETEKYMLDTINEVTKGYTKIIIAHRLKTMKDADLILIFDKGKIVEKGTHEELMNNGNLYKTLIDMM